MAYNGLVELEFCKHSGKISKFEICLESCGVISVIGVISNKCGSLNMMKLFVAVIMLDS